MVEGLINKVIPFSSVDGPGNRTAIFLQGCNFNCIYCHNPETINLCKSCGSCISSCPVKALTQDCHAQQEGNKNEVIWNEDACKECDACTKKCHRNSSPKVLKLTADKLLEGIMPYKAFIQGITVSGGECTLQKEFLIELFKKAKALGLTCYLDTNGSSDFEEMEDLLELTDGIMLDVKVWDEEAHKTYIGMSNKMVLKNLHYLRDRGKLFEVRTVVVPEIFNNMETVEKTSRIIGEHEIRYKLIKYRSLGVREIAKTLQTPSSSYMKELKESAVKNGVKDIIIV